MKLKTREVAIFGMLGALMYASKVFMELLPNVHLLGVFTISFTLVYRKKALYPIYTYVLLNGLFAGFATWWIPYLYLWTILWGVTMLLPQKIPKKIQPIVYMIVNACHGFLFGTLYAPAQAILFGLSFKGMIAWIIAGLPWGFVHMPHARRSLAIRAPSWLSILPASLQALYQTPASSAMEAFSTRAPVCSTAAHHPFEISSCGMNPHIHRPSAVSTITYAHSSLRLPR